MRNITILAAALATGACGGGAGNNAANQAAPANAAAPAAQNAAAPAANAASSAAGALPQGFPDADRAARGAECAVYLGLAQQANARPGGHDGPIMEQAAGQWRASLRIERNMSETEVDQLVASSVNPLMDTPAAQRDAAAAWCVDNAPEPDPDR